jgi:hypothetical protein
LACELPTNERCVKCQKVNLPWMRPGKGQQP